jgi:hypothetical protein
LDCELEDFDAGDLRISALTDKKWVIYPFISTQKDYGYSDVTERNNLPDRQQKIFAKSNECMKSLLKVISHFDKISISDNCLE